MPVHITKFPSKDFEEQFEERAAEVWTYFENARKIARSVQEYKAKQTKPQSRAAKDETEANATKCKSAKTKVRRGCEAIIEQLMVEYDACKSFVRQAKQCAEVFDDDDVRFILALCHEYKLLPSRDLFIQLVPVPDDERMAFAADVIQQQLSTRKITHKRIETHGRSSKGTKKPKAPTSLFEAKEQIIKEQNRIKALGQTVLAAAGSSSEATEAGFTAPAAAASKVRTANRALASLRKLFEDAIAGNSAA